MSNTWTGVYERKEDSWVAWCAEMPEEGAIGRTLDEARQQLSHRMELVMREREAARQLAEELAGESAAN